MEDVEQRQLMTACLPEALRLHFPPGLTLKLFPHEHLEHGHGHRPHNGVWYVVGAQYLVEQMHECLSEPDCCDGSFALCF